jgi:hypothetical protein
MISEEERCHSLAICFDACPNLDAAVPGRPGTPRTASITGRTAWI